MTEIGTITPTQQTRLGRMLAAGRLTATMRSKKTQQHVTLTLEAMKKDGKWGHVPFAEASHVFIKMGQGGYGSTKLGTYYPSTGKLYFDTHDRAWQFAVEHTLRASCSGQQDTSLYEIRESDLCGRCGKALTDPESIARGLGPHCFGEFTNSVHYTQDEANLVEVTQDRVREVSQRPSPVPGNRPITTEVLREDGNVVAINQHGGTNYDRKGRNVPRTFEALAAAVNS